MHVVNQQLVGQVLKLSSDVQRSLDQARAQSNPVLLARIDRMDAAFTRRIEGLFGRMLEEQVRPDEVMTALSVIADDVSQQLASVEQATAQLNLQAVFN